MIDGDAEILLDGAHQEPRPPAILVVDAVADALGDVDPPVAELGDVDPQVARDGEHRYLISSPIDDGDDQRVGVLVIHIVAVATDEQDVDQVLG